jgi:electron transport complex protein RnfA
MPESLLTLIGVALANNLLLTHPLGTSPLLGATARLDAAHRIARASAAVAIGTALPLWALQRWLLEPAQLGHLRLLATALLAALLAQLSRRTFAPDAAAGDPAVARVQVTINAVVIAALAAAPAAAASFAAMLAQVLGLALGFLLVLPMFVAMRLRFDAGDVPRSFRGAPIALVNAALMALAFAGLAGFGAR